MTKKLTNEPYFQMSVFPENKLKKLNKITDINFSQTDLFRRQHPQVRRLSTLPNNYIYQNTDLIIVREKQDWELSNTPLNYSNNSLTIKQSPQKIEKLSILDGVDFS